MKVMIISGACRQVDVRRTSPLQLAPNQSLIRTKVRKKDRKKERWKESKKERKKERKNERNITVH